MIVIVGAGKFDGIELDSYSAPPAWRKATRNMIMATASIERALVKVPGWMEQFSAETGLVLGSNSGELETSSEFLITLSRTKMARPVLFQNSLHNATTGFASIHYKLTGPTFSVSSGRQNPRECLMLAQSLIQDGICGACLVTLVEGHKMLSGFIQTSVSEGAATLLLASAEVAAGPEFVLEEWAGDFPPNEDAAPLFGMHDLPFYRRIAKAE